jgi:hypothetical protein
LSERVLLGEYKAGMTILVGLDAENDELTFEGISSVDQPVETGEDHSVAFAGQE